MIKVYLLRRKMARRKRRICVRRKQLVMSGFRAVIFVSLITHIQKIYIENQIIDRCNLLIIDPCPF